MYSCAMIQISIRALGSRQVFDEHFVVDPGFFHDTKVMVDQAKEGGVLGKGRRYGGLQVGLGRGDQVTVAVLGKVTWDTA